MESDNQSIIDPKLSPEIWWDHLKRHTNKIHRATIVCRTPEQMEALYNHREEIRDFIFSRLK